MFKTTLTDNETNFFNQKNFLMDSSMISMTIYLLHGL
jgi:hypothetical protein